MLSRGSCLFPRKPKPLGSSLPVSFIFIPFHSYPTGFCGATQDCWRGGLKGRRWCMKQEELRRGFGAEDRRERG